MVAVNLKIFLERPWRSFHCFPSWKNRSSSIKEQCERARRHDSYWCNRVLNVSSIVIHIVHLLQGLPQPFCPYFSAAPEAKTWSQAGCMWPPKWKDGSRSKGVARGRSAASEGFAQELLLVGGLEHFFFPIYWE